METVVYHLNRWFHYVGQEWKGVTESKDTVSRSTVATVDFPADFFEVNCAKAYQIPIIRDGISVLNGSRLVSVFHMIVNGRHVLVQLTISRLATKSMMEARIIGYEGNVDRVVATLDTVGSAKALGD